MLQHTCFGGVEWLEWLPRIIQCGTPLMIRLAVFYPQYSIDKDHRGHLVVALSHLPITRMQNRDQYGKSIKGVSGLALEESKMHTFFSI